MSTDSLSEFRDLYVWNGEKIEDVRFWCEPELTTQAIRLIESAGFSEFDGFATFEARGFFLAGIAASIFKKPVVMIRKHKRFYEKMDHEKITFTNWKEEAESLTILDQSLPNVRSVLVVDDILDTGRSLHAGRELLHNKKIDIVGAFYLLDARRNESQEFNFEIKSVLKYQLL